MTKPHLPKNSSECTEIRDSIIQLTALNAILFDTPDAINTKIELIQEELNSGRYTIRSAHIATKLLEFAQHTAPVLETA